MGYGSSYGPGSISGKHRSTRSSSPVRLSAQATSTPAPGRGM